MGVHAQSTLSPASEEKRHIPHRPFRRTTILWLIASSCLILFLPLYLVASTVRGAVQRLDANLAAVQLTLTSAAIPGPHVQPLLDELVQVQEMGSTLEAAHTDLTDHHVDWSAVMAAIGDYDPALLTLDSIRQSDRRLTLRGHALSDSVVLAYSQALESSALFSSVVVESIAPFAPPTSEPGPTTTPAWTRTPAPNLADAYEIDDFAPQLIFVGQPQWHNFYPIHDVDRVQFLAKAGRYYRVSTTHLSPGVDTCLTVVIGGKTYTNDDRGAGLLNSEVLFRAGEDSDRYAAVKITNRGIYSPDSWYQIVVEELVIT
ncbi:MAG TPA: hypothetical protein ENN99_06825, partial [Chloroflexi bacterium]|nr:hypothetical protein [Chloroflexota bacterium]